MTTSKALKELIRVHVLWISGEKDTTSRGNRHYKGPDETPCLSVWKEKKNGKTNVTRVEVSEGETTKR